MDHATSAQAVAQQLDVVNVTNPLWGPYMQGLMSLRKAKAKSFLNRVVKRNECTAIGFNLNMFLEGAAGERGARPNASPFEGGEITQIKDWYWDQLDMVMDWCDDNDVTPIIYGIMFPTIRRGNAPALTFRGRAITNTDWSVWREPAVEAWVWFWRQIQARYEDHDVIYVDGTEPFTAHLPHPPNAFTEHMQKASIVKPLRAGLDEIHTNLEPTWPRGSEALATDGWGYGRRWRIEEKDGKARWLTFAGLPADPIRVTSDTHPDLKPAQRTLLEQELAAKWVGRYFVKGYEQAAADGRPFFLVLHTTSWDVGTHEEASSGQGRPGATNPLAGPFGQIYRKLRKVARKNLVQSPPPFDEIDLKKVKFNSIMADITKWKIDSDLYMVDVRPGYIEQRHTRELMWDHIYTSPEGDVGVNANPVVIARVNGQWHGATYEWIAPTRGEGTRKTMGVPDSSPDTARALGPHIKDGPLAHWRPKRGEEVYFLTATPCRHGFRGPKNRRTQAVKVIWPY